MATKLTTPVSRESNRTVSGRPIIVTLAPCGSENEARIGLRLKGNRLQYVVALSDVYRMAALTFGQKESRAKREARKAGIPWQRARKNFIAANSIT